MTAGHARAGIMAALFLAGGLILTPAGTTVPGEPQEADRAWFRSLWGDLWDPDAMGTVRDPGGIREMTLAQAADVVAERAHGRDWPRHLAPRAAGLDPADGTTAAGTFELLEVWFGEPWLPEPRTCNRGGGENGHHHHTVHMQDPVADALGWHDRSGLAWSDLTQVPGYGVPIGVFIDHGSTHPGFQYTDRNVTYAGNSDFYCIEFGYFWIKGVVHNPRVTMGAVRVAVP